MYAGSVAQICIWHKIVSPIWGDILPVEVSHPLRAPLCLKSIDMQITISFVTSTMADEIQKAVKALLG